MAWIAQILGWLSVAAGAFALFAAVTNSDARGMVFLAPGLILGGVMIALLGEIAANVERLRQLGDKQSQTGG